MENNTWW